MRRRPIVHPMRPEQRTKEWRTVCEVSRQAWRYVDRSIEPANPKAGKLLKSWLEEMYDLQKRMDKQLRAYKDDYVKSTGIFEKKQPGDDKQEDQCSP